MRTLPNVALTLLILVMGCGGAAVSAPSAPSASITSNAPVASEPVASEPDCVRPHSSGDAADAGTVLVIGGGTSAPTSIRWRAGLSLREAVKLARTNGLAERVEVRRARAGRMCSVGGGEFVRAELSEESHNISLEDGDVVVIEPYLY